MFSRLEWGAGGALPGHTSLVRIKAWYDRRARPLEKDTEARGRGSPVPHAHLGAFVPPWVPDWSTGAQPPPTKSSGIRTNKKNTLYCGLWGLQGQCSRCAGNGAGRVPTRCTGYGEAAPLLGTQPLVSSDCPWEPQDAQGAAGSPSIPENSG